METIATLGIISMCGQRDLEMNQNEPVSLKASTWLEIYSS